jgi:hypothetical protein
VNSQLIDPNRNKAQQRIRFTKLIAICVLGLQIILLIIGTIAVIFGVGQVAKAGGGFVPGFEAIELRRLISFLAPYLALPISFILTVIFYRKAKYVTSTWLPLAVIAAMFATDQLYLRLVPDPITENFGARTSPYPGFLVLPAEAVPPDFREKEHHYTKTEYMITFRRMAGGKKIDLDIAESVVAKFVTTGGKLVQRFTHQGITGEVYVYEHKETQETSFNLIWLNPPKQRIAIYLTQTPAQEYSPEDLINVLKRMRLANL